MPESILMYVDNHYQLTCVLKDCIFPVELPTQVAWLGWQRFYQLIIYVDHKGSIWKGSIDWEPFCFEKIQVQVNIAAIFTNVEGSMNFLLDENKKVWGIGTNCDCVGTEMQFCDIPVSTKNLENIETISVGYSFALFLQDDGTVWGLGNNREGQIGEGPTAKHLPELIKNIPKICQIAACKDSLLLDVDGFVWAAGKNSNGQLGLGHRKVIEQFTKIEALPLVKDIAAGSKHSTFIDMDNNVWGCGSNKYHQLGLEENETILLPQKIPSLSGIVALLNGEEVSFFFDENGITHYCGYFCKCDIFPIQTLNIAEVKLVSRGMHTKSARKLLL